MPAALSARWRLPVLLTAGALAASWLYVRGRTREAEADNPPKGAFLEVDGVHLHYIERGKGPPLVLLHGNGILSNDFDTSGLLDLVARHYRVIVFDRPGYGYSERPRSKVWTPAAQASLLHEALQQLGVERPIVLAHSWGTLVALAMALQYPDEVQGLVLMSGYYYPTFRIDTAWLAPPAIPLVGDMWRWTIAPLIGRVLWRRMVSQLFSPREVAERFKALPKWMMLRPSQLRASAAESAMMVPSAMLLARRYGELRTPVRIIAGMEDKIVNPNAHSVRLFRELAESDLHVEPGVGHMPHYAYPFLAIRAVNELTHQSQAPPTAEREDRRPELR